MRSDVGAVERHLVPGEAGRVHARADDGAVLGDGATVNDLRSSGRADLLAGARELRVVGRAAELGRDRADERRARGVRLGQRRGQRDARAGRRDGGAGGVRGGQRGRDVMPVPSPRVAAPCAWAAASGVGERDPGALYRAAAPLACAASSGAVSVRPVPSARRADGLDRARLGRGAGVDDQRVAGDEAGDARDLDVRVAGRGGRGERRRAALRADRADRPDLAVDRAPAGRRRSR